MYYRKSWVGSIYIIRETQGGRVATVSPDDTVGREGVSQIFLNKIPPQKGMFFVKLKTVTSNFGAWAGGRSVTGQCHQISHGEEGHNGEKVIFVHLIPLLIYNIFFRCINATK